MSENVSLVTSWCVKCQRRRTLVNVETNAVHRGRIAVQGRCPACGTLVRKPRERGHDMDRSERMIEKRIRERECYVDLYSTGTRRACAYLDGCPWSRVPTAAMRDAVRRGDEVTSLRRGGLRHFFLAEDGEYENLLWEACDLKSSAYLLGHGYTHETGLYDTHFWRKELK